MDCYIVHRLGPIMPPRQYQSRGGPRRGSLGGTHTGGGGGGHGDLGSICYICVFANFFRGLGARAP